MNCLACGLEMSVLLTPDQVTHPTCLMIEEPVEGEDPFSVLLKQELVDIIKWQARRNPREWQTNIGPSEIGNPCDRHIGYRLVDIPAINVESDPWASIVGTAIHAWLDKAVREWNSLQDSEAKYLTETELVLDEIVTGHADLYDVGKEAVVDWKTAGADVMRKVVNEGPPDGYKIQTHIYGYLFERAGFPVKKVALVFLPRASTLSKIYVWSADYSRTVAETALARMYGIARKVLELDILTEGNGHRWEQLDATPGNHCGFCPWYNPGRDPERGADATGCMGR
jgi:PD-(D/E)XK nuclease superfamily protein